MLRSGSGGTQKTLVLTFVTSAVARSLASASLSPQVFTGRKLLQEHLLAAPQRRWNCCRRVTFREWWMALLGETGVRHLRRSTPGHALRMASLQPVSMSGGLRLGLADCR